MVIVQCLNVVLFLAIMLLMPWQGFILWFFGGFFILLIQLPTFIILLIIQINDIKRALQGSTFINWKKEALPVILLISSLLLIELGEKFHFTDPFYDDAFTIEASFHKDHLCSISLDGEHNFGALEYEYNPASNFIYCRNDQTSLLIDLHGSLKPGTFRLIENSDLHAATDEAGGALFDDRLGAEYSTSIAGSVYWNVSSGTLSISDVTRDDQTDKGYMISGSLTAIAKRKHEGP